MQNLIWASKYLSLTSQDNILEDWRAQYEFIERCNNNLDSSMPRLRPREQSL